MHGGKALLLLESNSGFSCLQFALMKGDYNRHSEVVRVLEEAYKEYGFSQRDIDVAMWPNFG